MPERFTFRGARVVDPASGRDEISDVFVEDGALRAEHSFWVWGFPFLTLHYRIARKPAAD